MFLFLKRPLAVCWLRSFFAAFLSPDVWLTYSLRFDNVDNVENIMLHSGQRLVFKSKNLGTAATRFLYCHAIKRWLAWKCYNVFENETRPLKNDQRSRCSPKKKIACAGRNYLLMYLDQTVQRLKRLVGLSLVV